MSHSTPRMGYSMPFYPVPQEVAARDDLLPSAKLLFGVIVSKSTFTGYCWASNSFLAGCIAFDTRQIQYLLSDLQSADLLRSQVYKERGNRRHLWPDPKFIPGERDPAHLDPAAENPWEEPLTNEPECYTSRTAVREPNASAFVNSRTAVREPNALGDTILDKIEEPVETIEEKAEQAISPSAQVLGSSPSKPEEDKKEQEARQEEKIRTARAAIQALQDKRERRQSYQGEWASLSPEGRRPFLSTAQQELEAHGVESPPARAVESRAANLYELHRNTETTHTQEIMQ